MREFPTVHPEPTSFVPAIAENDEFPRYTVTTCHDFGGRAFERKNRGGVSGLACRSCRYGAPILYRKSNYGANWENVRKWVLERESGQCWECGARGDLHVHHIENLVWFKTTEAAHRPENLVALCERCHNELEDKPDYFENAL